MPKSSTEAPKRHRRLLVALPALNEEASLGQVIEQIPKEVPGIDGIEVLVVDDGSTDQTSEIARAAGVHLVRHPRRLGVGAAFHSALAFGIEENFDFIATIDADGQFDPGDIPHLAEPVIADRADFATASRFKDPELVPKMPLLKLWGNRLMSWLISSLTQEKFYDVSCGMRCYSRRAAQHLHLLANFTYTQEVFLNLAFKNMRLVEVPLKVRGTREFGKSRVASNLVSYGWRTSQIIFRCYRDYNPLRFFGTIATLLLLVSAALLTFLGLHYLSQGAFSPHKWAAFVALALGLLAVLSLHLGIIGDMLNRHRVYLEEVLYRQRGN